MTQSPQERVLQQIVRVGMITGQDVCTPEQRRRGLSHEPLKRNIERSAPDRLKTLRRAERLH
jgi:hypothetical protein